MKEITKRGVSLFTMLLMVAVAIGFMPQWGVGEAHAVTEAPAMVQGTDVLSSDANSTAAQTVYMADTAWRVIGYDGAGAASATGLVTLISSTNVKVKVEFQRNGTYSNHYDVSNLKAEVDLVAASFTDGERSAIQTRDLVSGTYAGKNTDCVAGGEVKDALLWPLSTKEAGAMDLSLRRLSLGGDVADNCWWLRSPGYDIRVANVDNRLAAYGEDEDYANGMIDDGGCSNTSTLGVRPAFYLNPESLVLVSAAEGGKSSGKGKVTFKKTKGNGKIAVGKAGKVTVKKNLKKGKTYKVKVKVAVAGNEYYKKAAKTVTLKVKVR